MKQILFVLTLSLGGSTLWAQRLVTESSEAITLFFSAGIPTGGTEVVSNSITYPSLMANFQQGLGFGMDYSRKLVRHVWIGVSGSSLKFSGWNYPNSDIFSGATLQLNSGQLNIIYKSTFHETGLKNRFRYYGSIGTAACQLNVRTPGFIIQQVTGTSKPVNSEVGNSNAVRLGIMGIIGIEYPLEELLAVTLNAGYNFIPVNSNVYLDQNFQFLTISIGLQVRMSRNRNYLKLYE